MGIEKDNNPPLVRHISGRGRLALTWPARVRITSFASNAARAVALCLVVAALVVPSAAKLSEAEFSKVLANFRHEAKDLSQVITTYISSYQWPQQIAIRMMEYLTIGVSDGQHSLVVSNIACQILHLVLENTHTNGPTRIRIH